MVRRDLSTFFRTCTPAVLTIVASLTARAGEPVGTAFVYQGQIKEAGVPLNGAVDVRVELFDAEVGGNPVGAPALVIDVPVVKGLFTVELDFGTEVFNGQARWAQIDIRNPHDPAGVEPFTAMNPRQPLTAAPYALFSLAPWRQFGANVFYAGGNVGIGTSNPSRPLHISAGLPVVNLQDSDGLGAEQSGYVRFADQSASESGWIGFRSPSDADLSLMNNQAGGNTELGAGGTAHLTVTPTGAVGVGTSSPDVPLHITGGTDASPTGGGYIQAGSSAGVNVVIDENEIMARNNGAVSNLHINNNGGDVIVGGAATFNGLIHPNGGIDLGYELVIRVEQNTCCTDATCSPGKRVIGGGCETDAGGDALNQSRPTTDGTGWHCRYDNGVFGDDEVAAYAICIDVPEQ